LNTKNALKQVKLHTPFQHGDVTWHLGTMPKASQILGSISLRRRFDRKPKYRIILKFLFGICINDALYQGFWTQNEEFSPTIPMVKVIKRHQAPLEVMS
jgi:hypothetical protein